MGIVFWQLCTPAAIFSFEKTNIRSIRGRMNCSFQWFYIDIETMGEWFVHFPTPANDNYDLSKQVFYV